MIDLFYEFCKKHNFMPIRPLDKKDGVYITSMTIPSKNSIGITIREEVDKSSTGFKSRNWYIVKNKNCLYYIKEKEYKHHYCT